MLVSQDAVSPKRAVRRVAPGRVLPEAAWRRLEGPQYVQVRQRQYAQQRFSQEQRQQQAAATEQQPRDQAGRAGGGSEGLQSGCPAAGTWSWRWAIRSAELSLGCGSRAAHGCGIIRPAPL